MILWGIDLGGTKIECAVIDFQDDNFEIIFAGRLPTEAQFGYQHILSQIQKLIEIAKIDSGLQPKAIGIATPGIIDKQTKMMKNANVVCFNGKNLSADLSKWLNIAVVHANDANCFTLAEALYGAGKVIENKAEMVFGVILGTGVGGGIVINNQVYEGLQGIAGEWGHSFIENTNTKCHCGKNGCLESFISGPALQNFYYAISNHHKELKDIYADYLKHASVFSEKTIIHLKTYFGKAIAQVINVLDPELIILGGGVSNIDALYVDIEKFITPFLFNDKLNTPILKHTIGDSAGVIGAALLTKKL